MQGIVTSQARFEHALNAVLQDEGGYSDDLDDPGGATNLGITQSDLNQWSKKLGLPPTVKELTRNDASIFYKVLWWDKYNYNAINSLVIATKVFDLAVNMGAVEAHKLVQRALNYSGYGLQEDGVLGRKTLDAINEMCLHGREEDLDNEIKEEATHYYETITEERPKLYKFLNGWIKRADE
jgi:lysozyme family protein